MPSPGGYTNAPIVTENRNSTMLGPNGQSQGSGSFLIPIIASLIGAGSWSGSPNYSEVI